MLANAPDERLRMRNPVPGPQGGGLYLSELQCVGIADEGQVSRLMMNLQQQGLLEDTRVHVPGNRKAWRLTSRGEGVLRANRPLGERKS